MIKRAHEMTLNNLIEMDLTGSLSCFKRNYNILPTIIFIRKIKKEVEKIMISINNGESAKDGFKVNINDDDVWNLKRDLTIDALRANYSGVIAVLDLKTKIDSYKLSRRNKRKVARALKKNWDNSERLKYYIEKLNKYVSFNIEKYSDFNRVRAEIERMIDKRNEKIIQQNDKNKGEGVSLSSLIVGIFTYMEQKIDTSMNVNVFIELKKLAEKKSSELLKQRENGRN